VRHICKQTVQCIINHEVLVEFKYFLKRKFVL